MQPHDEDTIDADEQIIRRIDPVHHVVRDHTRGCNRISTKAYALSTIGCKGMSVDIESLILEGGHQPKQYVTTPKHIGSVSFSADQVRALNLMIGYDPVLDNPYHGEVWRSDQLTRFSASQKRGLLNAAKWYVEIPDVEIY